MEYVEYLLNNNLQIQLYNTMNNTHLKILSYIIIIIRNANKMRVWAIFVFIILFKIQYRGNDCILAFVFWFLRFKLFRTKYYFFDSVFNIMNETVSERIIILRFWRFYYEINIFRCPHKSCAVCIEN